MKDNLIASSRRTTPVQEPRRSVQVEAVNVNKPDQRQLFPHPPTQHFQPSVETRKAQQQPPLQHTSLQRNSQDIHRDPCFQQTPPQYSHQQRQMQMQPPPVEVNEMGPTIQQGVIQCPV